MSARLRPNDTEHAWFIVNPHSGGGATTERLDSLRRSIDRYFTTSTVRLTEGPGHATALAREAVESGANLVVAVGGDGTASETHAGLYDGDTPLRRDVVFTVVPAGTGSDFVRTLGMPRDLDDAVRLAAFGPDIDADAMHVTFVDGSGQQKSRIGLNVTGFGMNGDTVARANRGSKRFGGTLTFFGATVASLFRYTSEQVDLSWTCADGSTGAWQGRLLSCFIANGSWCGGGMLVGPGGSVSDGALDLTVIPAMSVPRVLALTPHLYRGTLGTVAGVQTARITALQAVASNAASVAVDVDGEQPGHLPFSVSVLAKAVRLRGVWDDPRPR